MKLTLYLIALCSYLALSVASIIPDKKDSENDAGLADNYPNWPGQGGMAGFAADADRTSHDATEHEYAVPGIDAIPGGNHFGGFVGQPIIDAVIPVSEPDYGTDEFSEHGFQPESSALPVAPEFPHPIPQFRID